MKIKVSIIGEVAVIGQFTLFACILNASEKGLTNRIQTRSSNHSLIRILGSCSCSTSISAFSLAVIQRYPSHPLIIPPKTTSKLEPQLTTFSACSSNRPPIRATKGTPVISTSSHNSVRRNLRGKFVYSPGKTKRQASEKQHPSWNSFVILHADTLRRVALASARISLAINSPSKQQ